MAHRLPGPTIWRGSRTPRESGHVGIDRFTQLSIHRLPAPERMQHEKYSLTRCGSACRQAREKRILLEAVRAFGAYGVEGASLRNIARKAAVSLTLINHHFGSEASLAAAAVAAIKSTCAPAAARLAGKLATAGTVRTAQLIEMWIDYLEDAFGAEAHLPYLQLMTRLKADPGTDLAFRNSLDIAEPYVRNALIARYSRATERGLDASLRASSEVLLNAFAVDDLRCEQPPQLPRLDDPRRNLLIKYLSAALDATLHQSFATERVPASLETAV